MAQRTGTIDTEITQKNRQIDRENQRLADVEAELKRKYTAMEGALQSLDSSSKRLNSFNQQSQ
jgi:flagellar capping protein FliD